MRCADCGVTMQCIETRQYHDPNLDMFYVERRKICRSCGTRLKTIEVPQDRWAELYRGYSDAD